MSTFISGPGNFQGIGLDTDINIRKEDYVNFIKGGRWVYLVICILLLLFIALSIMTIIEYFNLANRGGGLNTTGQIIENTVSTATARWMAAINILIGIIAIAAFVFILIKFITFKKWRGEQFRRDLDMARSEQEAKVRESTDAAKREILDKLRLARQKDLEAGIVGAYVGGEDIQSLELEKGKLVDKIKTLKNSEDQIETNKTSLEAERDGIEATIKEFQEVVTALTLPVASRTEEQKVIADKYKDYNTQYVPAQLDQLRKLKDAATAKIGIEIARLTEVNSLKEDVEVAKRKLDTKIGEVQADNEKRTQREALDREISRYEKTNPTLAETLKLKRDELRRGDAASAEQSNIEKIKKLTGLTEEQISEAKATAQAEQKAREDPVFRVAWEEAKREKARKAAETAFEDREREAIELLIKSGLDRDAATKTYKDSLTAASPDVSRARAKLEALASRKTEAELAKAEVEARLERAKAAKVTAAALAEASGDFFERRKTKKDRKDAAQTALTTAQTALTTARVAFEDATGKTSTATAQQKADAARALEDAMVTAEIKTKEAQATGASFSERRKLRKALAEAAAAEAEVIAEEMKAKTAAEKSAIEAVVSAGETEKQQKAFEGSSKYTEFDRRVADAETRAVSRAQAVAAAQTAEAAATQAAEAAAAAAAAAQAATPAGRAKAKEAELKAERAAAEARRRELIAEQSILEEQQAILRRQESLEEFKRKETARIEAKAEAEAAATRAKAEAAATRAKAEAAAATLAAATETARAELAEAERRAKISIEESKLTSEQARVTETAADLALEAAAKSQKEIALAKLKSAQVRLEAFQVSQQAQAAVQNLERPSVNIGPALGAGGRGTPGLGSGNQGMTMAGLGAGAAAAGAAAAAAPP